MLHRVSDAVDTVTGETRAPLDDMLGTMHGANGRGLAGVQIVVLRRLGVVDVARQNGASEPMRFVDPEIVWMSDEKAVREERCRDGDGAARERTFEGLTARVMQHEVDHLDGVLILDKAA